LQPPVPRAIDKRTDLLTKVTTRVRLALFVLAAIACQ
jgi:hypothetical protein